MTDAVIKVEGVKKYFPTGGGFLGGKREWVRAVDGVSFEVERGSTLAIVGESGSGKTTLGRTIVRLYEPTAGKVYMDGRDVSTIEGRQLTELHKHLQMVFQDPISSLNPRRRIEDMLLDPLNIHSVGARRDRKERVKDLMDLVQLTHDYLTRYPHSLSGGERQRVNLARALALSPRVLVLDEPTSALDVSVQATIISLLMELKRKLELTYVLITHNLVLVKNIADTVAVMYHGRFVEVAPTGEIFRAPAHPYTRTLFSSISLVEEDVQLPPNQERPDQVEYGINLVHPPKGCRFYARCALRIDKCKEAYPELKEIAKGHFVSCYLA